MEIESLWRRGVNLVLNAKWEEFEQLLREVGDRGEDGRALAKLLEVYAHLQRGKALKVIGCSKGLFSLTADRRILARAYLYLAWALRATGDLESSTGAARKALELADSGEVEEEAAAFLASNLTILGDLTKAEELLEGALKRGGFKSLHALGVLRLVQGRFAELELIARRLLESGRVRRSAALELLGYSLEGQGHHEAAAEAYARGLVEEEALQSPYSLYFLNKLLRLSLGFGVEVKSGTLRVKAEGFEEPEAKAAHLELRSLLKGLKGAFSESVRGLASASEAYFGVNQPIESLHSAALGVLVAKREDSGGFWRAMEALRPALSLYPDFLKSHAGFSELWDSTIFPLVERSSRRPKVFVRLFGPVEFDGLRPPSTWRFKKALRMFLLLVVNEGRSLDAEYVSWILWKDLPPQKARRRLYSVASWLRKELGKNAAALKSLWGSYALDTSAFWVDLWEFRNFLRRASSAGDPSAKALYLRKALELWRGPLLEGFEEEWARSAREEARAALVRSLEEACGSLLGSGEVAEALSLAQEAHRRLGYPETGRACVDLLLKLGMTEEAKRVYSNLRGEGSLSFPPDGIFGDAP